MIGLNFLKEFSNKLAILAIVACVLFIGSVPATATEVPDDGVNTVIATVESEAFCMLDKMGFISDDIKNVDKDSAITRAQFIGTLFRITGYDKNLYIASDNPFIDVSFDNPYRDEIIGMYNLGIISGTSHNEFSPDMPITYEQASKVALDVLGYKRYTELSYEKMDYPFSVMAMQLDLDLGIGSKTYYDLLTVEQGIQFLYNVARTDVMEITGVYPDGTGIYKIKKDKELLQANNHIFYEEGILESDGLASITGSAVHNNVAVVDGKSYKIGDASISEMLGSRIKFFFKDGDYEDILLGAVVDEEYDGIKIINSSDLLTDDSSYSILNIVYNDDGDAEDLEIDVNATVVWNYRACYNREIKPHSGKVKFIDNDGNKSYDVVIVEEFNNLYVDNVSLNGNLIIGKYDETLCLNDYENVRIYKNGKLTTLDQVPVMCVVSYIASDDNEYLNIYVNEQGAMGVIDKTTISNGIKTYNIAGNDYKLAYNYEILKNNNYNIPDLVLGRKYSYYLDMEGNIAEIQEVDGNLMYALVMNAKEYSEPFVSDGTIAFRLLLENGQKVTAVAKEEIKVNGVNTQSVDLFTDDRLYPIPVGSSDRSLKKQVVKVALDKDGYIKELLFAENLTNTTYKYDVNKFSLDGFKERYATYSSSSSRMIENKFYVKSDALIFGEFLDHPSLGDEPYYVLHRDQMRGFYGFEVYDCDEALNPQVIYATMKPFSVSYVVLVDEVITEMNDEGEIYKKLNGWWQGERWSARETEYGVIPDTIKKGDIVKISPIVFERRISKVELVASLSDASSRQIFVDPHTEDDLNKGNWVRFSPLYAMGSSGVVTLNHPDYYSDEGELAISAYGTSYGEEYRYITAYDVNSNQIFKVNRNSLAQAAMNRLDGNYAEPEEFDVWVCVEHKTNSIIGMIAVYYR